MKTNPKTTILEVLVYKVKTDVITINESMKSIYLYVYIFVHL